MSERTDSIPLPPDMARCEPVACTMGARCARKLASIPPKGASMVGAGTWSYGGTALCAGYVSADGLRRQASPVAPRKVHPPLGSV